MFNLNCKVIDTKTGRSQTHFALASYLSHFVKTRRSPESEETGFTILESLVAAVVVGILIVSIAPMVALSTSARVNARRIDQATQAARSYIDAVRGGVIDTTGFPTSLIKNTPNAQGQYVFEDPVTPSNSIQPPTAAILSLDSASATTPVRGIKVDTNGNGFSVDDPQDLFIQPMRSGSTDATILKKQGFWLAVRVYRADALLSSTALRTGTEASCNTGRTAFSNTASITCPVVTVRSQILPTTNANNLDDIKTGIGSTP